MADFGGFSIETPQEVLARIQTQRAKARESDNFVTRAIARNDEAFDALFGNVDVKRAEDKVKEVSTAISSAVDALPENASDIERARTRLRAAQSVLERNDPTQALKIEGELLKLDQEEFERGRLLNQDARAQETHESTIRERELRIKQLEDEVTRDEVAKGAVQVLTGSAANPQVHSFNISTDEGKARLEQFLQDNPDAVGPLDPSKVADIIFPRQSAAGDKAGLKELGDLRKAAFAAETAVEFGTTYLKVLRADPRAFTAGNQLSAEADALTRNVESLASNAIGIAQNGGTYGEYLDSSGNVKRINDRLAEAGITNARLQGLATNLAYALARSLDPSGRLSDKDVEFAIRMIGGNNPSAEAVAKTIRDNVGTSARLTLERMINTAPNDLAPFIANLDAKLAGFNELAGSFSERNPGAPSETQVVDAQVTGGGNAEQPGRYKTSNGATVGY